MNHWKETAEILSRLAELRAAGRRAALATVVRIVGSAYRRPGAKFLIEETGDTLGSVSGGCLEADVREVAKGVLATGIPSLRHYSTGADEDIVWGLGLGCNGLVDVFVQPATEGPLADLAGRLRELLAGDSPFGIATVVEGEGLGSVLVVAPDGTVHGSLGSADLDALAAEHGRGLAPASRRPLISSSAAPATTPGRSWPTPRTPDSASQSSITARRCWLRSGSRRRPVSSRPGPKIRGSPCLPPRARWRW